MTIGSIASPCVFSCTTSDWAEDKKRSDFITNLLDYIELCNKTPSCKIITSNELYASLWQDPPPPWRQDRDMKIRLVQTLYVKWHSLLEVIEATSDPESLLDPEPYDLTTTLHSYSPHFKSLICSARILFDSIWIHRTGNFCPNHQVIKVTKGSEEIAIYPLASNQSEWSKVFEFHSIFFEARALVDHEVIDHVVALEISRLNIGTRIYKIASAEKEFTDKLKSINDFSLFQAIIFCMAKRCCMLGAQASSDEGLQDEIINGEHRIRVSGVGRIHYTVTEKRMKLTKLFGPGEHDDGLN